MCLFTVFIHNIPLSLISVGVALFLLTVVGNWFCRGVFWISGINPEQATKEQVGKDVANEKSNPATKNTSTENKDPKMPDGENNKHDHGSKGAGRLIGSLDASSSR